MDVRILNIFMFALEQETDLTKNFTQKLVAVVKICIQMRTHQHDYLMASRFVMSQYVI